VDCPVGLSIAAQKGLEMTPDKVIITITAEGMNVSVFSGEKELSNRSSVMLSAGESQSKEKGDFYDDLPDHDDLAEALDSAGMGIFDISCALYEIHERE
jgi:hypothetical protein